MARDALFDLATNRALSYALRLGLLDGPMDRLRPGLEPWYLKTRFAYRIPLEDIIGVLRAFPGEGYVWRGGPEGGWVERRSD